MNLTPLSVSILMLFSTCSIGQSHPLLHSMPEAPNTVLLDFDAGTVQHPFWNKGKPIVATPVGYTAEQQRYIWQVVAESFSPFNINVTLDKEYYARQPATQKVRIIYTLNYFHSGGGIAERHSFRRTDDSPAWVFADNKDRNLLFFALSAVHEASHTLGLEHDGSTEQGAYFRGTDGWSPIMGSHVNGINQWSQGDYPGANNQQDDLATLTDPKNGIHFKPDDHSNSYINATPLRFSTPSPRHSAPQVFAQGIIERNTDLDTFAFSTSGGVVDFRVISHPLHPMLDIAATLYRHDGNIVMSSKPVRNPHAAISTYLPAGHYYLQIDGDGDPDGVGYSDYGSLGTYRIQGSVQGVIPSKVPTETAIAVTALYPPIMHFEALPAQLPFLLHSEHAPAKVLAKVNGQSVDTALQPQLNSHKLLLNWQPQSPGLYNIELQLTSQQGLRTDFHFVFDSDTSLQQVSQPQLKLLQFSREFSGSRTPPMLPAPASYALDGNTNTKWVTTMDLTTPQQAEDFLIIENLQLHRIEAIELFGNSASMAGRPKHYEILISDDQQQWQTLAKGQYHQHQQRLWMTLPPSKAKYFQLKWRGSMLKDSPLVIDELRFYHRGSDSAHN